MSGFFCVCAECRVPSAGCQVTCAECRVPSAGICRDVPTVHPAEGYSWRAGCRRTCHPLRGRKPRVQEQNPLNQKSCLSLVACHPSPVTCHPAPVTWHLAPKFNTSLISEVVPNITVGPPLALAFSNAASIVSVHSAAIPAACNSSIWRLVNT